MVAVESKKEALVLESPFAFLVFELVRAQYCIRVEDVREIITGISISQVPGSPSYLSGVTNLRGRVLPIIDLRKRFRFEEIGGNNGRECFVVLAIQGEEGLLEFGISVDAVCEVARIKPSQIDTAPSVNSFGDLLVFNGVVHTSAGLRLILDTRSLVSQLQQDIQSIRPSPNEAIRNYATTHQPTTDSSGTADR